MASGCLIENPSTSDRTAVGTRDPQGARWPAVLAAGSVFAASLAVTLAAVAVVASPDSPAGQSRRSGSPRSQASMSSTICA